MSLSIQQLNSDCTFLFTFSPASATSDHPDHLAGTFNILVDPWLAGESSVLHPSFQYTRHTEKPHITSLADFKQKLDLIIISQDKPDHCHRETLCTLPQNQQVNILTTPAAAKKIKSWNYFSQDLIHVIPAYDAKRDKESTLAIKLPSHTPSTLEGEITITHIPPTRLDLTKVHNGIAITYRPPGTISPTLQGQKPQSSHDLDPPHSPPATTPTPTPQPTLSILYTPHGLSPPTLKPYLKTHLLARTTTLTTLIHSLSHDVNPTCLGGTVVHGAPGGLAILHSLRSVHPDLEARFWVGAHDGPVERGGWSVRWLKCRGYGVAETQGLVEGEGLGGTRVVGLGGGGSLRVGGGVGSSSSSF